MSDIRFRWTARVEAAVRDELNRSVRPLIGRIARQAIAEVMRAGGAQGKYRVYVDGVLDAREETVGIPGVIEYTDLVPTKLQAVAFVLASCITRSPHGSQAKDDGARHFAENWRVYVNRMPWAQSIALIPPRAEVAILNVSDYARKIDVGGQRTSVPPQIIETVRQLAQRRFQSLLFERIFITIPGGYVLRGHAFRSGLTFDKKRGFTQATPRIQTNRSDARRGQVMTYPALIINERW